jgi:nucleotide-binding universal stress UspA family protein
MTGKLSTPSAPASKTRSRQRRASRGAAITRIAAGIDGFAEGRDAAALGKLLADATGAELMLVSVYSSPLVPMPPGLDHASLRNESRRILREVRDSCAPGARTLTATNQSVARTLQRVVQRHHRDLLVVGSSRQGPEGHVRIGKRTRQLLCNLESALAVAPRRLHVKPRPLGRIAVGYDGGPESDAALAVAASIADGAGAELLMRAVVDDRLPGPAWSGLSGLLGVSWEAVIQEEMEQIRDQALASAQSVGAQPVVTVERGRPANALLALSQTVDLLVIGSRRWGPTARLLLGSTGEALMHDAACAVLAVPRAKH